MDFKFTRKKGSRKTFIALPGVMSDRVSIDFLLPSLKRHGNVLWVDYPSRRRTTKTLIKNILAEIEKRNLSQVIIIGYSYGGTLGRKLIDAIRDSHSGIKIKKFIAINAALDAKDLTILGKAATKMSSDLSRTKRSSHWLGYTLKLLWQTSLDPALFRLGHNVPADQIASAATRSKELTRSTRQRTPRYFKVPTVLIKAAYDEYISHKNDKHFKSIFPRLETKVLRSRHNVLGKHQEELRRLVLSAL